MLNFIDKSPEGFLIFIGGTTEAERTITSGKLYAEGLIIISPKT